MNKESNYPTKSEKREKEKLAKSKKQVKHDYGERGRDILKRQQEGISRGLKKILKSKVKIKK